jgi:hypothetical protein
MSGLDLKYDGIVYQQTGELLLELNETKEIRWMCAESYWRNLQVFAFGQIFGESLITMGEEKNGEVVPKPMGPLFENGTRAGEILLTKFFPGKRRAKLPSVELPKAEDLIKDPTEFRLKEALGRLRTIARTDAAKYWRHLAIREVYFGYKPIGQKDGFWRFDSREDFEPNKDKEEAVPNDFVEQMRLGVEAYLGKVLDKRDVTRDALPAFIRRNVVMHLAIHPVPNIIKDPDFENPENSARVFNPTRESLVKDEATTRTEATKQLWRIQDLVVPGLVKRMIEDSAREAAPGRRREVLVEKIQEASVPKNHLEPIREKLSMAVAAAHGPNQDLNELMKLRRDLEKLSSKIGATPKPKVLLSTTHNYPDEYENAISVLADMGAGPEDAIFHKAFNDVFPELVPHHPVHIAKD